MVRKRKLRSHSRLARCGQSDLAPLAERLTRTGQAMLLVQVDSERFALPAEAVSHIVSRRNQKVEPVPRVPSFIRGMTNLRGQLICVVSLAERFGLESQPGNGASLVVVNDSGIQVALEVDRTWEVVHLDDEAYDQSLSDTSPQTSAYVSGIAVVNAKPVTRINLQAFLEKMDQDVLHLLKV